jgi:endonuclease YncB( thermonuclease family)
MPQYLARDGRDPFDLLIKNFTIHKLLLITIAGILSSCISPPPKVSTNSNENVRKSVSETLKPAPAPTFTGKVVSVEDGDTITVLDASQVTYKIRLQGIDAPEHNQAFESRSTESLAEPIFQKEVTIEWAKRDRYGRIVGKVLLDGRDICLEQVRAGMAWHYKHFQNEQTEEERRIYAGAESEARVRKIGLWVEKNPTPPWEYRARR